MKTQITLKYTLLCFVAVMATWILHEFAHWGMGELLGYNMGLTLNSTFLIDEVYINSTHSNLVDAAGPIVTLIQAVAIFLLLANRPTQALFPFLFTPFYMRLMASIINFFSLNDEGRISDSLGLSPYLIPWVVSLTLLLLVIMISKKWAFSKKFIIWTTLLTMVFSSALILTDQFYHIRLI